MPGYNNREGVSEHIAQKAIVNHDFAKVDTLSIDATGEEYSPVMPTGSAAIDVGDLAIDGLSIVFDAGLGLATTLSKGYITIGTEKMRYSVNTGDDGSVAGTLTIIERGVDGTTPAIHLENAVITFLSPLVLSHRLLVRYENLGPNTVYINPEDFTTDKTKSLTIANGGVLELKKSAMNSEFIFCHTAETASLKVYNAW